MKIRSLHLKNFRRFKDFKIDFDDQLTVLVARNGAGKTSILDALAISLGSFLTRLPKISGLNPKDSDFRVEADGSFPAYMRIACAAFNGVEWDRTERRDQTKKTLSQIPSGNGVKLLTNYVDGLIDKHNEGQSFELPVFIYYGSGRGVFEIPQRKRGFKKEFVRFDSLRGALESRTNFKSFVEYFYSLEELENKKQKEVRSFDHQIPELKAIRNAVNLMMPDFKNPRGAYPAGIAVDWHQDGVSKELRIEQLSDGYRTTLAMVMDVAARMAEANPDMPDPLLTEGVVMIDEVDLHLHPGWQQTILLDLVRTFPNIQFVVSTHSPQVVSSVEADNLRVIEWSGDCPRLLDIPFSAGAEAQQMLLDVLGVASSRVESLDVVKDLHEYQRLVNEDKWDSERARELRRKLDEWGAGYEPELSKLDVDIRLMEWERNQ